MNTFTHPVTGYIHTQYTVVMSAHHTHGCNGSNLTHSDLNQAYHKTLGLRIIDIVGTNPMLFSECEGMYDGITEQSYIIHAHDLSEVLKLREQGACFNQECILVIDHHSETALLSYMDGQVSIIGKNLEHADIDCANNYTQIGSQRYVVA